MRDYGFGKADSLSISGEINMPLVIIKNSNNTFNGFIPGLTKNDIVSDSLDLCKINLKEQALNIIKDYKKNNTPFPFFPTKEELLKDFENVCYISFIKIKSTKRFNN